jgi:hypothetical protein
MNRLIGLILLLATPCLAQRQTFYAQNIAPVSSSTFPGWQFRQDVYDGSNGTTNGSCGAGTKCTIVLNGITTSSSKSAWVVAIATTNNVTISRVCTNDTTCASGNDNWTLCATSGCHQNNASLGLPNEDMAYNVNGTVSSSSFTVILSGSSGSTILMWIFEVIPPSGFTPSFDGAAVATHASCSTCTMAAPSVSGTDAVFHFPNPTLTQATVNPASSPYFQDFNGTVFGMNITSSTAPTFTQTSGAFMDSAIAFKTTSAFTSDSGNSLFSIFSATSQTFAGISCNASPGCTVTIPSTGTGDLIYIQGVNINGDNISSVTGAGSWTVPSGANTCQVALTADASDVLSCAYNLSSSSGTTTLTIKTSGTASFSFNIFEVSRSSGSFTLDVQSATQNATSLSPPGSAVTLTGANDVIFQSLLCPGGCNEISYYPYSSTNTNGGNGPNFSGNSASVARLNTNDGTAPIWGYTGGTTVATAVAFK